MAHIPTLRQSASSRPARLIRTAALAPALLAALAACDSSTEPGSGPSRIQFTYVGTGTGGTIQGTYNAEGDFVLGRPQLEQTFAIGHRYADDGAMGIISNVARSATLPDYMSLTIPRLTVGSAAIDPDCATDFCAGIFLGLELPAAEGSQAEYSCSLQAGTLRITAISETRMRGDFSGTGVCLGAPGTEDLEEFRITGGTFDVKVIEATG